MNGSDENAQLVSSATAVNDCQRALQLANILIFVDDALHWAGVPCATILHTLKLVSHQLHASQYRYTDLQIQLNNRPAAAGLLYALAAGSSAAHPCQSESIAESKTVVNPAGHDYHRKCTH